MHLASIQCPEYLSSIVHISTGFFQYSQANSFGTSVASRALTMGQVVIVASIMEFLGAVLLGAGVTSTIKSGVADLDAFVTIPRAKFHYG